MEESKAPVASATKVADTIKTSPSTAGLLVNVKHRLQRALATLPIPKRKKNDASGEGLTGKKEPWWRDYNLSQLCYFAAFFLLLLEFAGDNPEPNYLVLGLIALVGLTRELLGLFHYLWSFTLGKASILILYATTANVALAFAAMQINLITGVEPTPFIFTLGFTTVVLLPFWVTLASMLFFLIALLISTLWLLIRLPLRLIGVKLAIHWEDKKSPFVTMVMRIILIPYVLMAMFQFATPYFLVASGGAQLPIDLEVNVVDSEEGVQNLSELDPQEREQALQEIEAINEKIETEEEKGQRYAKIIRSVIASFLFNFEAYPNSACKKEPEQRSVIIDENMVLIISRDESADYGYRFEVALCEPRVGVNPVAVIEEVLTEEPEAEVEQ